MKSDMRQNGFTLIELVVVLLVMGILAATATTYWSFGDTTVTAQAGKLAQDIRHLQILAMTEGQTLRLETLGSSYRATDGASVIPDPATQQNFVQTLDDGVTLSGGPVDFDSFGRPVSGGSLKSTATTFTVSGTSTTATVSISPVTGFVSVSP